MTFGGGPVQCGVCCEAVVRALTLQECEAVGGGKLWWGEQIPQCMCKGRGAKNATMPNSVEDQSPLVMDGQPRS